MTKRNPRATNTHGALLGDFVVGDQIGDYVVDSMLPSSGTGIVYAGHHVAVTERQVVIRVMPLGESLDEVAHALDELDHPGTPRIFGSGTLNDNRRWIAVERIAGPTLAEVLEHRTLSATEVLALLRDVATLLARAHAEGIVHGHITPENILVPDDKRFAICLTGWEGARLVTSKLPVPLVAATAYTAPEQMQGELDDARTDMYAVGVITYRALHGVLPGVRQTLKSPTLLETLIDQMLCLRPDLRPTSARIRAAVSWLCTAGSIGKKESWIVPTVSVDIGTNPRAWENESWIEQTVMDSDLETTVLDQIVVEKE